MKKIIAFVALMCLFTTFTYAAEMTASQKLYSYGFIEGDSGDLMEEQLLTRAQACVLLAQMYGQKSDAEKYIKVSGFPDVNEKDWFASYVAFAKANKWISGFPDGTFMPNSPVTKQQWSAMLLNVLGYDYKWESVVDDLSTIGINYATTNQNAIKRGESFNAMWQALLIPSHGDNEALGVVLGKLPESDYSLVEKEPEVLDIENFEANGLTEIQVFFNKALETGLYLDPNNFKIIQADNYYLSIDSVVYGSDNNILIRTNIPMVQNVPLNLTLPTITAEDNSIFQGKEITGIEFIDSDYPYAKEAELIGKREILVTFSEPVMGDENINPNGDNNNTQELSEDDFSLNSGKLNIYKVQLYDNNTKAIIRTYSEITDDVSVYVKNTIKDFANNSMQSKVFKVKMVEDKEKPYITEIKDITPTSATVVWNEPIQISNTKSSNYYHTNSYMKIDNSLREEQISGNEMHLVFSQNPIVPGQTYLYVDSKAITDYFGNYCDTQKIQMILETESIPPQIKQPISVVDERHIAFYFSEMVKNDDNRVTQRKNYQLSDFAGNDLDDLISSVEYNQSDQKVTIAFNQKLSGVYQLSVNNIQDYYGNVMKDNLVEFEVTDLSPPDPSSWNAKVFFTNIYEQNVIVEYDEDMLMSGKYSVLDYENYMINGISLGDYNINQVKIKKIDPQTVQITVATAINGGFDIKVDSDDYADSDDLVVARVADVSGNYTKTFENRVDLSGRDFVEILAYRYIGNRTFEIVLSQAFETYDMKDFKLYDTYKEFTISSFETYEDSKERTVLVVSVVDDIDDLERTRLKVKGQNSKTLFGETLDSNGETFTAEEYVPAEIELTKVNGVNVDDVSFDDSSHVIKIRMTKAININSLSLFTFDVTNAEVEKITASSKYIYIYIDEDDSDNMRIGTNITQLYPIIDSSGIEITGLKTQIEIIK